MKGLFTRREGYPSKRVTLALEHSFISSFFPSCLQSSWGYLGTLEGRSTFSLVNTPGRVTRLPGLTFLNLFPDPLCVTAH